MLMTNQFTAIVEKDGPFYIAYTAEVPGANGQGETKDEALESLKQAITLIFADRREDTFRGLSSEAEKFELTLA